mgnify:CR=1 FL=1
MKINHIYLLFGIFIIILLSSCLGGCYREGLATTERKDHKENKEDAMRQFKENNDSVQMMPAEDDVNNKNGLIGPGGEQWIFGPGGEQQRQPGESEGEYIDQIHNEYANNYNKDVYFFLDCKNWWEGSATKYHTLLKKCSELRIPPVGGGRKRST